jgi:hypothetical protein
MMAPNCDFYPQAELKQLKHRTKSNMKNNVPWLMLMLIIEML